MLNPVEIEGSCLIDFKYANRIKIKDGHDTRCYSSIFYVLIKINKTQIN